jgi:hypothetical protein
MFWLKGENKMEVMGVALTILGLILAYIWSSNGKMQRMMIDALSRIEEGQKEISAGQKEIARMINEGLKYLADIFVTEGKLIREQMQGMR